MLSRLHPHQGHDPLTDGGQRFRIEVSTLVVILYATRSFCKTAPSHSPIPRGVPRSGGLAASCPHTQNRISRRQARLGSRIDNTFYEQLRECFDEEELLDLGMTLTFALGWQRFIDAFGIRPDTWNEGMDNPWAAPEHSDAD